MRLLVGEKRGFALVCGAGCFCVPKSLNQELHCLRGDWGCRLVACQFGLLEVICKVALSSPSPPNPPSLQEVIGCVLHCGRVFPRREALARPLPVPLPHGYLSTSGFASSTKCLIYTYPRFSDVISSVWHQEVPPCMCARPGKHVSPPKCQSMPFRKLLNAVTTANSGSSKCSLQYPKSA